MSITHAFTSAVTDGVDDTVVQPSDWNADHVISDLFTTTTTSVSVDITVSTSVYTDVLTVSLVAGTWLVYVDLLVQANGGATGVVGKLWDGSTVYESSEHVVGSNLWAEQFQIIARPITLVSTTSIKISLKTNVGAKVLADTFTFATGSGKASRMFGLRIG